MLERWPTAEALAAAGREELIAFARAQRTGYVERFADRVMAALAADHFAAPAHLVAAKVDTIRLLDHRLTSQRSGERAEPDRLGGGEIYLSFPGLGVRLAGRIAGELGDHIEHLATASALQCYAGQALVTRRSGKRELVVAHRVACNRYLADAVHKWPFASLRRSGWAKQFYDAQRARGKSHNAALRALGNRWLEVLWHCLHRHVRYDEAVHVANRNRTSGPRRHAPRDNTRWARLRDRRHPRVPGAHRQVQGPLSGPRDRSWTGNAERTPSALRVPPGPPHGGP